MVVCFFGHGDTPPSIQPRLRSVLVDLIEREGADRFYVGNHGSFDAIALRTLKELKARYTHITYAVVLAYLPTQGSDGADTVYPEGLEQIPRKFTIDRRNRWMLERADTVVCYVTRSFGGAAKYRKAAIQKGKRILDLYEKNKI